MIRNFRGKRVDNGEWAWGDYSTLNNGENKHHYILDPVTISFDFFPNGVHKFIAKAVEVIPESIGRSTGLKDEGKVEAYQHDMVSAYGYDNWTIVWHDNGWTLQQENIENYQPIPEHFIVIGTIHDSPNLLEKP